MPTLTLIGLAFFALLHLALWNVLSYRMARRGRWLALPWVLAAGSFIFQAYGAWVGSQQGAIYVNWLEWGLSAVPGATALPSLVMLIVLAIKGPRLKSAPQVEASDANS